MDSQRFPFPKELERFYEPAISAASELGVTLDELLDRCMCERGALMAHNGEIYVSRSWIWPWRRALQERKVSLEKYIYDEAMKNIKESYPE